MIGENNDPAKVPEELWPGHDRLDPFWAQGLTKRPSFRDRTLYEALLPLVDERWLNLSTIDWYKASIAGGKQPIALALSVVDMRFPSGKAWDWRLMHFLLDGHHKRMPTSQLDKPIRRLSFLAIDESLARNEWVTNAIKVRDE